MATGISRVLGSATTSPASCLRWFGLVMLVAMLTACGGGGDDSAAAGPAPALLTSITVSPANASVNVGLTQTVIGVAKDQNGAVMSGVSFTWASSNSSVASVSNGVATGVAAGTAAITASSGGVTSNAASLSVIAVAIGSVAIDKPMAFFPAIGRSAQLTAQALDPLGAPASSNVVWTSSAPDKVSVDASGQIVARAIGSAQIFAAAAGIRSAPTLVIVAEPKPGALLVTDAQVVSVGPPLRLAAGASPGVGTEYEVTLQGVVAPAAGTIVIATETAPVAGNVVSTRQEAAGLVVTLAIAPLYQLFSAYDIALTLDLSAFAIEAVPDRTTRSTLSALWNTGRSGKAHALARARPLAALEPFKAFDCDASIKPQLVAAPIQLSFENKLTLVLDDRPGYSKHALEGSAALVGSAGLKLKAGFKAAGRCDAQAQIKFPVFGWFSVLAMPAVRFGLGAELEGEILLVQGELGVEGKIGFSPVLGWECGGATPACRGLDDITRLNELKTKSKIPSENDMQAKVSAQFYVLAGLDASIGLGVLNAGILEARVGPKQSFDLAFEDDQAARPDYAATYELKLEGVVEPGGALQKAIEMVIGDDSTTVQFKAEFSTDLSESPKGSLSVSKARVRPDSAVDFTVDFAPPSSVAYFLLGYNVTGVELYRKREDELKFTPWKSMTLIGSHRATYQWTPVEADAGKYEFAAFVNTQVLTPLLEIAPNSIQAVEVSCFSGSALSASTGSRKHRLAAAAAGARVSPLATTCADTWVGTASVVAKTPGLPGDNIASHSNITWTYDPSLSGNGATYYTPSGSFDLAFNSTNGCTFALSPRNFTIVNDPLNPPRLGIIDDGFNPPSYRFVGSQLVNTTVTASCPGENDVVSQMNGYQVFYASGNGPFTVGQANLSGSSDDGAIVSTWNFSRP